MIKLQTKQRDETEMEELEQTKQMWNIYQDLRTDIRQTNTLNSQILGIIIAAVAVLLVKGFESLDPFIFLSVFIVTFPGYMMLAGNRRHIWRISTYLRVFLEPQLEFINWETDVTKLTGEKDSKGGLSLSSLASMNEWLILFLVNTLATAVAVFTSIEYLVIDKLRLNWLVYGSIAAYLVITVIITMQAYRLGRGGAVEKHFYEKWKAVWDKSHNNSPYTNEISVNGEG